MVVSESTHFNSLYHYEYPNQPGIESVRTKTGAVTILEEYSQDDIDLHRETRKHFILHLTVDL